jgi:hypothetical protein
MAHPVVYRVQALHPRDLSGVRFHGERRGGDLSHITPPEDYEVEGRGAPVVFLCDEEGKRIKGTDRDWVKGIRDEIKQAAAFNTAQQVEELKRAGKGARARRRAKEGDKPPYRAQGPGPLREILVSVNAEWFDKEGGPPGQWDGTKVIQWSNAAIAFVRKEWGPALRYVRIDFDEDGPHLHAVAAPWVKAKTPNGAEQKVMVPRLYGASQDLEKGQDRAGEAFAHLGIVRGERHAEARRQAKAEGREPEPKRGHVPPRRWRQQMAEKEARLEKQAEELREAAAKVAVSATVVRSARLTAEERARVDGAHDTVKAAAILANRVKAGDRARDEARRIAIAKNARAAQARKGNGGQGQGWDR